MSDLRRGKGWMRDAEDAHRLPYGVDVAAVHPQDAPDLRRFRAPRKFQGGASSCVSFAKMRAFYTSMRIQGCQSPVLASPLYDYWIARVQENDGRPRDRGSYPSVSMTATQRRGICPWHRCIYSDEWVDKQPELHTFRDAHDQAGLQWYAIQGEGQERIDGVEHALLSGYPVIFGMLVDQAFEDNSGELITSVGKVLGGHMMDVLAVSNGELIIDNSWRLWGNDDGLGRLSKDLFGDPAIVSDVMAIRSVPVMS